MSLEINFDKLKTLNSLAVQKGMECLDCKPVNRDLIDLGGKIGLATMNLVKLIPLCSESINQYRIGTISLDQHRQTFNDLLSAIVDYESVFLKARLTAPQLDLREINQIVCDQIAVVKNQNRHFITDKLS